MPPLSGKAAGASETHPPPPSRGACSSQGEKERGGLGPAAPTCAQLLLLSWRTPGSATGPSLKPGLLCSLDPFACISETPETSSNASLWGTFPTYIKGKQKSRKGSWSILNSPRSLHV